MNCQVAQLELLMKMLNEVDREILNNPAPKGSLRHLFEARTYLEEAVIRIHKAAECLKDAA